MMAESKAKKAIRDAIYRASHKSTVSARNAEWRASHKQQIRAYNKSYKANHKDAAIGRHYTRTWFRKHKARINPIQARERRDLKLAAFGAYGGPKCACCGETLLEGLTIDHVNGDGAEHRRRTSRGRGGDALYRWLKRNDYPSGFQVLCGTCNMAKGTTDHCPHEDLRIAWG